MRICEFFWDWPVCASISTFSFSHLFFHSDTYGIGGVRTPEKFYEIYGIDVVQKTIEGHLCSFVDNGAKMHHKFTPYLRPDGMGIDYSKIDFRFKDPYSGQKGDFVEGTD
jgi:hypothetical protein